MEDIGSLKVPVAHTRDVLWLYILAGFLVSSDIFLTWRIQGFTLRAVQFVLALVLVWGLVDAVCFRKRRHLRRPLGSGALLTWCAVNCFLLWNVHAMTRNFGYMAWLLFNAALVFVTVQQLDAQERLRFVLRWYIYAYCASAVLGIAQFLSPFLGLTPPLIRQWWIPGVLDRVNGMTYEPSYYAMYMLCGFVMIDYLRVHGSSLLPKSRLAMACLLTGTALIVCGSRMGWMMMLVWLGLRIIWWVRDRNFRALRRAAVLISAALVLLFVVVGGSASFLLAGLGVSEELGEWSREGREGDLQDTISVFLQHPIMGVGLGGVGPEIARMRHVPQIDQDDEVRVEGQCTTMEVLAGTGIFGFAAYAAYLLILFIAPFRLKNASTELKALTWALIFLIAILQFNQNILRLYLWFHIALLSAAYSVLHDGKALRRALLKANVR